MLHIWVCQILSLRNIPREELTKDQSIHQIISVFGPRHATRERSYYGVQDVPTTKSTTNKKLDRLGSLYDWRFYAVRATGTGDRSNSDPTSTDPGSPRLNNGASE